MLKNLKAELHVHCKGCKQDRLNYSAKDVIDLAASKGYKILAITNHDIVTYSDDLNEYAKSKGILLIPAVERTIEKAHVLIYNVSNDDIKDIKKLEDLYELKKNKNIVIIASHPYYLHSSLKDNLEKHIDLFDGIEYCHMYTFFYNPNKKAEKIAKKYNKPLVGTSDMHIFEQFGHTYSTISLEEFTINGFLDAVKKGNIKHHTKRLPYSVMLKFFLNDGDRKK